MPPNVASVVRLNVSRISSHSRLGRKVCRRWDDLVAGSGALARRAWLCEKVPESQVERDMVKLLVFDAGRDGID